MFRLDKAALGTPCSLCRFNNNHKKLGLLPGTACRCSKSATGTRVGNHCPIFEINLDMLEHVVYNRVAIKLDLNKTGLINEDGTVRVAHAPLHILLALLEQNLEYASFRRTGRRTVKNTKLCIAVLKTVISSKLGSLSEEKQSIVAAFTHSVWATTTCPMDMGDEAATQLGYKLFANYGIKPNDPALEPVQDYVNELFKKKYQS